MEQVSKGHKRIFALLVGFMMIVGQSSYLSPSIVYGGTEQSGLTETVYMLTDKLETGQNYIVASGDSGSVSIIEGDSKDISATKTDVISDENGTYIKTPSNGAVWQAVVGDGTSTLLVNGDCTLVLDENGNLTLSKDAAYDMVSAKGFEVSDDGVQVNLYVESEIKTGQDEDTDGERGPPAEDDSVTIEDEDTPKAGEGTDVEKTGTVLGFTSDIHNSANNTAADRLGNWIDGIVQQYGGMDAMCFCGDMGAASANESQFWTYTKAVMDVVSAKGVTGVYTTGNHEFYNGKYATTSNAVKNNYKVDQEGLNGSNFRIYCLGTDNWDNLSDNYTTGQVTKLTNYLNGIDDNKPVIVLTHYPLHHYGSRTTKNADLIINALNDASANGKKIVLLWGHNHTLSDTHYDQIYAPGDSIEYASGKNADLGFYYAAAGCMSDSEYSGSSSAFVKGKGLIITINGQNQLTFTYYDADLKNVTEGGTVTEGDPVPVEGISVSPKTCTIAVGETKKLTVSFTPGDATNKAVNWTSSNTAVATVSGGQVQGIAEGTAEIVATAVDGGFVDHCDVTVTKGSGDISAQGVDPENSKQYVILSGDGYALTSEGDEAGYTNGSSGSQQYIYNGLKGDKYTVGDTVTPARLLWTFTEDEDGNGFYIQSQDGKYLNGIYEANDSGGYNGTLKLDETPDVWIMSRTTAGDCILKSTNASQSDAGDKYLTHGNGNESTENVFTMRSEDNATTATFYEYNDDGTYINDDPGTPVDPPVDPPEDGNIYKLVNQFTDGKEYLVVSANSTGNAYALTNPGGSSSGVNMDKTGVTIESGDVDGDGTADIYINDETTDIVWTAAANGDGFNITNGGDYLEGKSGNVKIFNAQQYADRFWTYADSQLKHTGGQNTYVVYYDNGFTSTYNSTSNKVYLFEKVKGGSITPVDPPDDPPVDPPEDGNIYKLANQFTDGKEYLVVSANSAGNAYALTNPGGSSSGADMGKTGVTIESGDVDGDGTADIYINDEATDIVWTAAANGDGFNITNGGDYLEGKSGNVKIFNAQQYADRFWTYTDSQLKHTGGQNTYVVYYDNGFTSTYNSTSNKVYIFEKVKEGSVTPIDPPVDPPAEGTNYKLVKQFTDGKEYLIVSDNSAGNAFALTNPGGSSSGANMGKTGVVVKSGDVDGGGTADIYINDEATDIVWTAAANGDGFNITNGGDYLEGKSGNVKIFNAQQYADRFWTYTDSQLKHTGGQNTYVVYYDNGFTSTYNSTTKKIYLYEKVETGTHAHSFGTPKYEWEADYSKVKATRTCSECGEVEMETVEATSEITKPATCEAKGETTYTSAAFTNSAFEVQTETIENVDALGHAWGEWEVTKPATCIEKGEKARKCERCGKVDTKEVPMVDHTVVIDEAVPATCTETGKTEGSHCSVCNEVIVAQEETMALGHAWGEWEVTKEATCTEKGEKARTCERCNKVDTKEVPMVDHTIVIDQAVPATCTETGLTEGSHCSVCEKVFVSQMETPKLDHAWGEWEVTKEATCTEKGEKSRKCEHCDAVDTEEVPMVDHTIIVDEAVPATCTKTGLTEGSHCSVCNEVIVPQEETPMIEHHWKHIVNKAGLLHNGSEYDQCTACKAIKNQKAIAGYAAYYVKSPKVAKAKKAFTVKWTKQSKANQKKFNGYQIRYAKYANMSGAKYTTAGKNSKSKKIGKLAKKTRYYVQVRTYTTSGGKIFYSHWSSVKSVKTK